MKDYVYPDLFPVWFTAVSQKLQWHRNKQWLVEDGLALITPASNCAFNFLCMQYSSFKISPQFLK